MCGGVLPHRVFPRSCPCMQATAMPSALAFVRYASRCSGDAWCLYVYFSRFLLFFLLYLFKYGFFAFGVSPAVSASHLSCSLWSFFLSFGGVCSLATLIGMCTLVSVVLEF